VSAFGEFPEWQKQLSKFASVQDRLSEWKPSVLAKIIHFSCIQIAQLDIDGFRMDKALQITVDPQSEFSAAMRQCARRYGKENFFIPGEIVNGNLNAAIYLGRGKEPSMKVEDLGQAINPQLAENRSLFIRDTGKSALDAAAFHYTTYRGLQRFLGLDGKLSATGEAPINFVDQWTEVQQTNDFINANTGEYDPRHMYGVSNQDVFRWPGITQGTERQLLGMFVTTIEMPGIPLLSWGEEQAFYALDNTASNYVFGRQAMTSSQAWQIHGCCEFGPISYKTHQTLHCC
jgi:alpha-1,3-glucan synthase